MRAPTPLHPLERALVTITGIHLCFLPWALGAMPLWSQCISLLFGVVGLVVALMNRRYDGELAPGGAFKLIMWPKLVRFPVFWLGLLLLGYILIQALNPAWVQRSSEEGWWMEGISHIRWLPSGMQTPLSEMSPWRVLVIYSSIWLLVSALWIGLTRRAAVQSIVTILVVNGAVLGMLGIMQRVTGSNKILWFIQSKSQSFVATIPYANHAGGYFNLIFTLAAGLLLWHYLRGSRRLARTNPAPVFGFCMILLGMTVLMSYSRTSTVLLVGFVAISLVGFVIWLISSGRGASNHGVTLLVIGVMIAFLGLGAYFLKLDRNVDDISSLFEERGKRDAHFRAVATTATMEMAGDKIVTGWGAGSFRYMFPQYQQYYPEIHLRGRRTMFWEYAHNDYAQGLAELGIVGLGICGSILLYWLGKLVRARFFLRPPLLLGFAGLCMTLLHSRVDFQAHNPAVLATWCAIWPLLTRWAELEDQR